MFVALISFLGSWGLKVSDGVLRLWGLLSLEFLQLPQTPIPETASRFVPQRQLLKGAFEGLRVLGIGVMGQHRDRSVGLRV